MLANKSYTKFCLSLHYNADNNYLFVNEKETFKYNGDMFDFFVDYNSIDKSSILNIQKYLMTKNNIK